MEKEPIFRIITGDPELPGGDITKEYKIYSDGTCEGFEDVKYIFNSHPGMVNAAAAIVRCELESKLNSIKAIIDG